MGDRSGYVPETAHEDQKLLLYKLYQDVFQFQYLLDSYNDFVAKGLPACLAARPIIFEDGREATIKLVHVEKPKYEVDGRYYDLMPETAMLEGRTYSGRVRVKIELRHPNGTTELSKQEDTLFNLPIMKYSDKCHERHRLDNVRSPKDPGCYFIVNGNMDIILLFEKARQNQFMIHMDKDRNMLPYVSQLTETAYATSQTTVTANRPTKKNITIGVRFNKYDPNKPDEVKAADNKDQLTKGKKEIDVNVIGVCYIINRLLNNKYSNRTTIKERFMETLRRVIPKQQYFKCYTVFAGTIADYDATSEAVLIEAISRRLDIHKLPEPEIRANIRTYLQERLLPLWSEADQKIKTLILMTARELQCISGAIKPTNQSHWGTRALSGPGEVLMDVLRRKISGVVRRTLKTDALQKKDITADDILMIVTSQDLDTKFMSEFKGLPNNKKTAKSFITGKKQPNKPVKAIAQTVMPINGLDLRTTLTKTRNNASEESSDFKDRAVEGSFWLFMCSYMLTENQKCGITKFVASTTTITTDRDPINIINTLLTRKIKGVVMVVKEDRYSDQYDRPVTVNGLLIGYTNATRGYNNIVLMKRHGVIPRQTCVVNALNGTLEIYTDARRLMIPVVVVDSATGRPSMYQYDYWKYMTFTQMLNKGLIEYLDNYEIENPTMHLAQTFNTFINYDVELERLRALLIEAQHDRNMIYEANIKSEINSILNARPTRVALHPIAAYGVTPSLIKFANNQQSCRTAFATKMQNQTIHSVYGDPYAHIDAFNATFGTSAIMSTTGFRVTGLDELRAGQTLTIAFISTYRNQEDSAIVSKGAIDRGLLRYVNTIKIKETLEDNQRFGRYNPANVHPKRLRYIGDNGIPATGVRLEPGDCVICKYEFIDGDENGQVEDRSRYLERDEAGVVTEVVTFYSTKSNKSLARRQTVSVKIELYSRTEAGNKIVTDHSQKYIISEIRADTDMPFGARSGPIHVELNALCIPTRMTTGSLFELIVGRYTAITGKTYDAGAHNVHNEADLMRIIHEAGFVSHGSDRLTNPLTGEKYMADIFNGPSRLSMLGHIAAYKIQCRGAGKKNPVTGQAEASKAGSSRDKGQKVSEHERIQLAKYGASFVATDRMNLSCDGETIVICRVCSSYAVYDPVANRFKCNMCGTMGSDQTCTQQFGKYIQPRTKKYLDTLMIAIGVREHTTYLGKDEYLRADLRQAGHVQYDETATGLEEAPAEEGWI